jgi:hypothetical protein
VGGGKQGTQYPLQPAASPNFQDGEDFKHPSVSAYAILGSIIIHTCLTYSFEKRINFNEAYATENVEDGILQIGKYIQAMSIQAETQTLAGASPTASTETVVECGPIQSLDEPPALNREASLLENKVVSEVDTSSTLSVATMFTNSTECAHDAAFLEDGESVQSAATLKGEGMLVEDTTSRHLLEVNLDAIDVGELN